MEYYGIRAVRGPGSILGRAEAWSKLDGVPEVFPSKDEADRQAERYNEGYSPNVHYYVKEMEPELAGSALRRLNAACAQAVDKAVTESHYDTYHYDLKAAAEKVVGEYGAGRVSHVLANIILTHEYDGRYSGANKAWAREFDIVPDNKLYCNTHPHVLDGFIDRAREITAEPEKETAPEKIHGYEVKQAVCFTNDRGFALAHNPNAPSPFVTWQFTDENGRKDMYWGHYFSKEESAASDYDRRVSGYNADYGLEEKYNYLAPTEMSAEQNYNMIDGCVNNEATRRADLTDGQTHDEIAELVPEVLPEAACSDERPSVTEKLKAAKEAVKDSPGRPPHEKKPSGLERG